MPRTKQVRKKSSIVRRQRASRATYVSIASTTSSANEEVINLVAREYESHDEFLQEIDIYFNNKMMERQQGYEKAVQHVKKMFSDILDDLPLGQMCLNVNKNTNDNSQDQNKDPNISVNGSHKSSSKISDGLFEFKRPKIPRQLASRSSPRKRSLSASSVLAPYNDGFKTPLIRGRNIASGATITPKIYSNTPISMMRRPQNCEMAISMSGSPLMVGAASREDIPTVTVPMQDGRVFSIMPQPGAPPPDLPQFDETTKNYLKTLRAHLEILAPNTP